MTLNYIVKVNRIQGSITTPKLCLPEMLEFPIWDSGEVSQEDLLLAGAGEINVMCSHQVRQAVQASPADENRPT